MADPKPVAPAEALKQFAKRNLTIVDFKRDSKGEIIVKRTKVEGSRDIESKEAVERALTAGDILKATDYGNRVEIITADGRRYATNDPVAKADDKDAD